MFFLQNNYLSFYTNYKNELDLDKLSFIGSGQKTDLHHEEHIK